MSNCYCVCHNPLASKAFCSHCRGYNSVSQVPRCAGFDPTNAIGNLCARPLPCDLHLNRDVPDLTPGDRFVWGTHVLEVVAGGKGEGQ